MSIKIEISHNKELKQTFEGQETDIKALGWLLRNQSNSTDHALRYEGWEVKLTDEQTGEIDYWKPYSRINI